MSDPRREIFVISDLHIGGRYPAKDASAGDRGFRMCTHVDALARFVKYLSTRLTAGADVELVINGDFIDFLAEESDEGGVFLPFIDDPDEVERRLDVICWRDAVFFNELAAFVGGGGRLTILLGNHDVELSFPAVRRRLLARLGGDPRKCITFLYDGEAYAVGDALIEHGNRYDGFNVVNHDALRRLRSLQSRRQPIPIEQFFQPPPGSRLVASIMNPIKRDYPFVDLLKPETEAVIPILLALEPSYRRGVLDVWRLKREADGHAPIAPAMPAYGSDVASTGDTDPEASELAEALRTLLGSESASRFLAGIEEDVKGSDVSSFGDHGYYGLVQLLTANSAEAVEKRLPALLEALRGLRNHQAFNPAVEAQQEYFDAARTLADGGFRFIVFGHTHLAKQVDLGAGRMYLNTGTWADLLQFPAKILDTNNADALDDLRKFVDDLKDRRFDNWIRWDPTYARLELVGDKVVHGELCHFDESAMDGM